MHQCPRPCIRPLLALVTVSQSGYFFDDATSTSTTFLRFFPVHAATPQSKLTTKPGVAGTTNIMDPSGAGLKRKTVKILRGLFSHATFRA